MNGREIVNHAKLIAENCDYAGYITYVFQNLEDDSYIMCVRYPNWEQACINIGDTGFLKVRYVYAGTDKWYDGNNFVAYKYSDIIFLKFIHEKENISNDIILD